MSLELGNDLGSTVSGAIINNDDPVRTTILSGKAFERGSDKRLAIVNRNDGGKHLAPPPEERVGPVSDPVCDAPFIEWARRFYQLEFRMSLEKLKDCRARVIPGPVRIGPRRPNDLA